MPRADRRNRTSPPGASSTGAVRTLLPRGASSFSLVPARMAVGRLVRAHQGGMVVSAPLVETEQHGSIRIQDLAQVVMTWRRLWLAKE